MFPFADPLEISPGTTLRSQWIRMISRTDWMGLMTCSRRRVHWDEESTFATRTKEEYNEDCIDVPWNHRVKEATIVIVLFGGLLLGWCGMSSMSCGGVFRDGKFWVSLHAEDFCC